MPNLTYNHFSILFCLNIWMYNVTEASKVDKTILCTLKITLKLFS